MLTGIATGRGQRLLSRFQILYACLCCRTFCAMSAHAFKAGFALLLFGPLPLHQPALCKQDRRQRFASVSTSAGSVSHQLLQLGQWRKDAGCRGQMRVTMMRFHNCYDSPESPHSLPPNYRQTPFQLKQFQRVGRSILAGGLRHVASGSGPPEAFSEHLSPAAALVLLPPFLICGHQKELFRFISSLLWKCYRRGLAHIPMQRRVVEHGTLPDSARWQTSRNGSSGQGRRFLMATWKRCPQSNQGSPAVIVSLSRFGQHSTASLRRRCTGLGNARLELSEYRNAKARRKGRKVPLVKVDCRHSYDRDERMHSKCSAGGYHQCRQESRSRKG